jgi:energy-coupling factor transport system permease protein
LNWSGDGAYIFTTDLDEMITSMVQAHVPYKLAFVFSSTLRFFPLLWTEFNKIVEAQRLRGLAMEAMGLAQRVRVYARVAVPLILSALVRSQQLEVVLQSRAFDGSPERTFYHDVQLKTRDRILIVLLMLVLGAGLFLRIRFGWGRFNIWF